MNSHDASLRGCRPIVWNLITIHDTKSQIRLFQFQVTMLQNVQKGVNTYERHYTRCRSNFFFFF